MNYQGHSSIAISQQDQHIGTKIQDSGCGIPSVIQDRIFEAFFTIKSRRERSDFELSIVQKNIGRHHGKIEITSEPGRTIV